MIFSPNLENKSVGFIAFRLTRVNIDVTCTNSLIINATLPNCDGNVENVIFKNPDAAWVGWEKNERGKFGPKLCNMSDSFDTLK